VQQDDFRRVTFLDPALECDVCLFGPLSKRCRHRTTFTSVPAKGLIQRDRLKHHEFGAVMLTERERIVEGTTCRLRKVHCCENARKVIHDAASKQIDVARLRPTSMEAI
jgi:hypothetical protein